jgi:hypothetical protein
VPEPVSVPEQVSIPEPEPVPEQVPELVKVPEVPKSVNPGPSIIMNAVYGALKARGYVV